MGNLVKLAKRDGQIISIKFYKFSQDNEYKSVWQFFIQGCILSPLCEDICHKLQVFFRINLSYIS